MRKTTWSVRAALLVVVGLLASACGLSAGSSVPLEVKPDSIRPVPALQGVEVTVGSKDFTEQLILGYITEFALDAAGMQVRDLTNIPGSVSARAALETGQVDVMWEYTGTGWINYLGNTDPVPGAQAQFEAVRQADLEQNGIVWTAMAPLDNTYAIAIRRDTAERYGLRTLSDLAELAEQDPAAVTLCAESEFANRNDGLPGMMQAYGFELPPENIRNLATGAIYYAVANGTTCDFGEVFTTDGRILALDLVVLEDDREFFPRYNASLTLRQETAEKYPEIAQVIEPIAKRLTNEVLLRLNARVDVEGDDPAEVARDWLVQEGFVSPA